MEIRIDFSRRIWRIFARLSGKCPFPGIAYGGNAMKVHVKGLLGAVALASFSLPAFADTTLTIATVNNGDMIRMQGLTDDFTKANPAITLTWATLEENVL